MRRGIDLPPDRFDAQGQPVCCWCGGALGPRRKRWCGQACVDEYGAQASQTGARRAVFRRDHGICALCGFDAVRVRRFMERLWRVGHSWPARPRRAEQYEIAAALLMLWGARSPRGTLWDADHTIPLVEGGSLALSNLRTLCLRCHRAETRALARRRAESRKAAKLRAVE